MFLFHAGVCLHLSPPPVLPAVCDWFLPRFYSAYSMLLCPGVTADELAQHIPKLNFILDEPRLTERLKIEVIHCH